MSDLIQCPNCTKQFKGAAKFAGKTFKCPACGGAISVPAAAPVQQPVTPAQPTLQPLQQQPQQPVAQPGVQPTTQIPSGSIPPTNNDPLLGGCLLKQIRSQQGNHLQTQMTRSVCRRLAAQEYRDSRWDSRWLSQYKEAGNSRRPLRINQEGKPVQQQQKLLVLAARLHS